MNNQPVPSSFDLICAYVHYTLCANFWYGRAFKRIGNSFNYETIPVSNNRAQFYDKLAWACMERLTLQGQKIASETYTRAYKTGKTPLNYPLPHVMQSYTVGAMEMDYPSETFQVFPGVEIDYALDFDIIGLEIIE